MEIILTESQLDRILTEERTEIISSALDKSKETTKRIINKVKEQYNIDFAYLSSYGAIIGGFIRPIQEYLNGVYPQLNDREVSLICFGLIMTFFSTNKEKLNKVLKTIKEEKLVTFFDIALRKAYDLRDAFSDFLESLKVSIPTMTHALAYAFIIPVLPLLYDVVSQGEGKAEKIGMLVKAFLTYKLLSISSKTLEEVLEKIIKRFRS